MALKLTPGGSDLLLRALAGEAQISFSGIQFGNGADAGAGAAELSNPLLTAGITSYEIGDIFVTLTAVFTNSEVTAGFRCTELGVLADDPDNPGENLLYAYGFTPDAQADYIPSGADKVLETQQDVLVYIGDAENVTASISQSLVYASRAELEAHVNDASNPHNVTAKQVGLDKVPNVATNDQTPTYTAASSLTALSSGEKLSVAFGKLAKAVSSLIAHLADKNNPHGVTAAQAGAAAESHQHSAADITSGTLSISRGGTGNSTGKAASATKLATARTFLVNLASSAAASFNGTANVTPGVTGVLQVANGGTGVSSLTGTDYDVSRVRGILFSAYVPDSIPNGEIVLVYA